MLRYQRSRWTPRIKLYCCIRNYLSAYDAGTSLYVDVVDTRIRRFAYCHGFRGQGFVDGPDTLGKEESHFV
jgi:hypothetical protein